VEDVAGDGTVLDERRDLALSCVSCRESQKQGLVSNETGFQTLMLISTVAACH